MAGSCDHVHLLFSCQVDEFDCISGHADGEVCVFFFFRMFHRIDQFFCSEYIYVQVMCTLIEVSVQYVYEIVLPLVVIVSQCTRADGLGVGDPVKRLLVRKF